MGSKTIWARCAYQVVIVPRKAARGLYTGMFRPLQRCVEIAAGKFAGVQVGRVDTEPDHMYITLFIPPKYAVSEVISAVKMRTNAMVYKISVTKGHLREGDDFRAWCAGYYVSTNQKRNRQEIAEYIREALAEDERAERTKVVEWHSDREARA